MRPREPGQPFHVAQLAERLTVNQDVAGSNPAVGAASTSEHAPGCSLWMVGRAAECAGLENQSPSRGPGFKSLTIRWGARDELWGRRRQGDNRQSRGTCEAGPPPCPEIRGRKAAGTQVSSPGRSTSRTSSVDRARTSYVRRRRFESCVRHRAVNSPTLPQVWGFALLAHQVEQRSCKPQVARSSRAGGSMQERRRTRGQGGRPEMGAHHHRGRHDLACTCVSKRILSAGEKPPSSARIVLLRGPQVRDGCQVQSLVAGVCCRFC